MDLFHKTNVGHKKKFSLNPEHTDYYEVLNIAKSATKSQIREAYIRLKNAFSSQSQALYSLISDNESEQMLRVIEEAFNVLNDDMSKREYDIKMGLNVAEMQRFDDKRIYHPPSNFDAINSNAFKGTLSQSLANFSGNLEYETVQEAADSIRKFSPSIPTKNICAETVDDEITKVKMQEAIEIFEMHDGELYRKLREIAGVSEEEMQDRTKVSRQYIAAIEQNAFENLPSLVFVKGFLRSYLKYLRVQQVDEMVKAFANRFENWQQGKHPKGS